MFETLPRVFGVVFGGSVVGFVFFLLVALAALTSSISMMETMVSILQDRLAMDRRTTCLLVLAVTVMLGIPSSLGNGVWSHVRLLGMTFLDFFDFISNNLLMPVVALLTCLFVGHVLTPRPLIEEARLRQGEAALFAVMIRWVAPLFILLILLTSVLGFFGILNL